MADTDMAALARERRERENRAQAAQAQAMPLPWGKGIDAVDVGTLKRAHRSIRMAHSLGLACWIIAVLSALLVGPGRYGLILVAAGVALARSGGAWVHNMLPPLLVRRAPS